MYNIPQVGLDNFAMWLKGLGWGGVLWLYYIMAYYTMFFYLNNLEQWVLLRLLSYLWLDEVKLCTQANVPLLQVNFT